MTYKENESLVGIKRSHLAEKKASLSTKKGKMDISMS